MIEIDYDGNERRGLTAKCRSEEGTEHTVATAEVVFPEGSTGARYVAAYRKWIGLDPYPAESSAPPRRKRQHKATAENLDLSGLIELVVLSVKNSTARCRLLGIDRMLRLNPSDNQGVRFLIADVRGEKAWEKGRDEW